MLVLKTKEFNVRRLNPVITAGILSSGTKNSLFPAFPSWILTCIEVSIKSVWVMSVLGAFNNPIIGMAAIGSMRFQTWHFICSWNQIETIDLLDTIHPISQSIHSLWSDEIDYGYYLEMWLTIQSERASTLIYVECLCLDEVVRTLGCKKSPQVYKWV